MKSASNILDVAWAGKYHTRSSAVEIRTGNSGCERPSGASGGTDRPNGPENISRRSVTVTARLLVFDSVTVSAGSVNPRERVVGPLSMPATLTRKPVRHAPFQIRLINHVGLRTALRAAHATPRGNEREMSTAHRTSAQLRFWKPGRAQENRQCTQPKQSVHSIVAPRQAGVDDAAHPWRACA